MNKVLFLCTGNYYRSRFAEFYFRHVANGQNLNWTAESRGLRLSASNVGPLSVYTIDTCRQLGICTDPLRDPIALQRSDLEDATLTIAVKESEHRPLMRLNFPDWEDKILYWNVHDIDCATPEEALPGLKTLVDQLVIRIAATPVEQAMIAPSRA